MVGGYQARPGDDLVTGIGTVDAALLVPELTKSGSPDRPSCRRRAGRSRSGSMRWHGPLSLTSLLAIGHPGPRTGGNTIR